MHSPTTWLALIFLMTGFPDGMAEGLRTQGPSSSPTSVHFATPAKPTFVIAANDNSTFEIKLVRRLRPVRTNSPHEGVTNWEVITRGEYDRSDRFTAREFTQLDSLFFKIHHRFQEPALTTADLGIITDLISTAASDARIDVASQALMDLAANCPDLDASREVGRRAREHCQAYHELVDALLLRAAVSPGLTAFTATFIASDQNVNRKALVSRILVDPRYKESMDDWQPISCPDFLMHGTGADVN